MASRKREREIEAMLKKVAARDYKMVNTNGAHIKVSWTDPRGEKHLYYVSLNPKDWRADKKVLADMRRMSNGDTQSGLCNRHGDPAS